MTSTESDVVQQTLAEYERLAIGTGEWDGTEPPLFSNGGQNIFWADWAAAWSPTDEHPHPEFVRATVHRKGVKVPTEVIVRWDEAFPVDDHWAALWLRKPTTFFGAFGIRAAFRRAFRDVIGDRHEPDEIDAEAAAAVVDRDWSAEIAECATVEAVDVLWKEARAARVVTVELEAMFRRRKLTIPGEAFARAGKKLEAATAGLRPLADGGVVPPNTIGYVGEPSSAQIMPRPRPSVPGIRPEELVRAPRKGDRRPQKPKPRGPRGA